ncbi:MAG: LapA family protein [Gammaproteobacteria bacterium]
MRRIVILVFAVVVFGIVLALALENLQTVQVSYLFGSIALPLAAILVAVLVIGALVGALTTLPAVLRARARARHSQSKLGQAEKEINNLRRAPLSDAR